MAEQDIVRSRSQRLDAVHKLVESAPCCERAAILDGGLGDACAFLQVALALSCNIQESSRLKDAVIIDGLEIRASRYRFQLNMGNVAFHMERFLQRRVLNLVGV